MESIATSPQGHRVVTGAVCPALFLASVAPQADIVGPNCFKPAGVRIPTSLIWLSLHQHMIHILNPPNGNGSHHWCWWCIQGILYHLLC